MKIKRRQPELDFRDVEGGKRALEALIEESAKRDAEKQQKRIEEKRAVLKEQAKKLGILRESNQPPTDEKETKTWAP